MAVTPRAFTDALQKTPLLNPAQQAELARETQATSDVRQLARRLVERGWLTSFQVNQLVLGRGNDLIVGSYMLLERLGEGGTGQVFKARHLHMNRIVAFKLIRKELLADREIVGRFHREIQLISSLTHPNVVHAYDAGPVGANYFLAMEYVESIDLARLVRERGVLPVELACDFIRQAATGLQHIHQRRLVHRDIKPSNLLVAKQEDGPPLIKILDLGLARLHRPVQGELTRDLTTTNPVMMGTLDYMAPEQALDFHRANIRADIYSLGCALYYLLTGRAPFPDGTLAQKLLHHQQVEPTPVEQIRQGVSPAVAAAVRRMMAKQPEARFQTPGEVAAALGGAPVGRALVPAVGTTTAPVAVLVSATVDGTPRSGRLLPLLTDLSMRTVRVVGQRRRWPYVAGAAAALLLLTVVGVFALSRGGSSAATPTPSGAAQTPAPPAVQAFLSDLPELNFQGSAFGKNGKLGHNGNGNLAGNPADARIIVKGVTPRKGISMLAPTQGLASVNYRLGKQFSTFKTGVSLHDGGWFSGSKIVFSVIGDGKVLWQSQRIGKHDDYPQECCVSVAGIDLLELQVTCSSLNSGVWPVWLDPVVTP